MNPYPYELEPFLEKRMVIDHMAVTWVPRFKFPPEIPRKLAVIRYHGPTVVGWNLSLPESKRSVRLSCVLWLMQLMPHRWSTPIKGEYRSEDLRGACTLRGRMYQNISRIAGKPILAPLGRLLKREFLFIGCLACVILAVLIK